MRAQQRKQALVLTNSKHQDGTLMGGADFRHCLRMVVDGNKNSFQPDYSDQDDNSIK